jgi:heme/copper-type cytochrome/quinol oxidase subunit 2
VNLTDVGMTATSVSCRGVLTVVWAWTAITGAVLMAMIYSVIAFQGSAGDSAATPARKSIQILWSLIPIAIFLGIAVPTVKALLLADGHCGL